MFTMLTGGAFLMLNSPGLADMSDNNSHEDYMTKIFGEDTSNSPMSPGFEPSNSPMSPGFEPS